MEILRIKNEANEYRRSNDIVINCDNIISIKLMRPLDNIDNLVGMVFVCGSDGFVNDRNIRHVYNIYSDSQVSTNSPALASVLGKSLLGEYVKVQPIKQY